MPSLTARAVRELYRREAIPPRLRWWLAAAGMIDFARILARDLRPHTREDSQVLVAALMKRMFDRRFEVLRTTRPHWPEGQETRAAVLAALYRLSARSKARWILSALGGPPPLAMRLRGRLLARELSALQRWEEVTVHLGELLIVATEDLPARIPHPRKILGDICFAMGVRYAERTARLFGIRPGREQPAPATAIELLRMSEYIFRVNPEHWSEVDDDAHRGMLEGTACPWYPRPGWDAGHCGIFGQFQAGISSLFGLKYRLSQTIPKHGGSTCRVDLVPLPAKKRS